MVDNVTINGPAMQCYSVQSGYWSDPTPECRYSAYFCR